MGTPVVLFDGVCNLCSFAVQWILRREQHPELTFAALQGSQGALLLGTAGLKSLDKQPFASIVFIDETGAAHTASDAVLQICRYLRRPWRWLAWLRWVPRPIRDGIYRFIAGHRYQWFGSQTRCMVPSPDLKSRFLD